MDMIVWTLLNIFNLANSSHDILICTFSEGFLVFKNIFWQTGGSILCSLL